MMKTYIHHTDPGHGWVAVKRSECIALGIYDKITHFSYQNGQTVYLEEDCDAGLFIEAYTKRYGVPPNFRESYQHSSPIRYYKTFNR